jgi:hypothetical protein
MSAHTPGPWAVQHFDGDVCFVVAENGPIIADQITEAPNARLIAAAPELLKALEGTAQFIETELEVMERSFLPEPNSGEEIQLENARLLLEASQAAITKAKGTATGNDQSKGTVSEDAESPKQVVVCSQCGRTVIHDPWKL